MAPTCCRLCLLNASDLLPILKIKVKSNRAKEPATLAMPELIVSYLSIEPLADSSIEAYICFECRDMITKWHSFREFCLQNDGVYQKMVQDLEKDDSLDQIEVYHVVEVKEEPEIEIGEHEFSENLYTEPMDEDQIGKVVKIEVKQEKEDECDEEVLLEPMDPPPREKLKRKISPGDREKRESSVKQKSEGSPMHNQDGMHRCPYCKMIFYTESNWKDHINIHTKEIKYICSECDKVFWRNETLQIHLKSHLEENSSNCHSEESTSQSSNLQCPYCPKSYRFLSVLLEHQRIHTEAPDVQCDGCERKFHSKVQMYRHAVTHRDFSGEPDSMEKVHSNQ